MTRKANVLAQDHSVSQALSLALESTPVGISIIIQKTS